MVFDLGPGRCKKKSNKQINNKKNHAAQQQLFFEGGLFGWTMRPPALNTPLKAAIRHSHMGFVYIFSYLAGSYFITKTNPESHFQE